MARTKCTLEIIEVGILLLEMAQDAFKVRNACS